MKQMKLVATLMLVLALIGSVISWNFRISFTGGLIFAACEAALVGALADWFAVVALFRHPMGLKFIPHTAIIPNNRGRIIEGIVNIVEKDWLNLDFIEEKIQAYPLVDGITAALDSEAGRQGLERVAQSITINFIQGIQPAELSKYLHVIMADNLKDIKVSPQFVDSLEAGVKNLYSDDLIRLMLKWAIESTNNDEFEQGIKRIITRAAADYSNQGNFMRRLSKNLGESLDIINYDEAAHTISRRINSFLVDMQSPDNHYYLAVKSELQNNHLSDSESVQAMLSDMLEKVINTEAGLAATDKLIAVMKNQLLADGDRRFSLISYLTELILEQFREIQTDAARKMELETWLKTEINGLLERYHSVIGMIVREKLQSLNDESLVQTMEDKVGNDLQWIRINGTVIGALVGITQYLIVNLLLI